MAFEILTARLPFAGASIVDVGIKQLQGQVDTSGIAAALAGVNRRAIAYEKDQRPRTASGFAEALRAAI